MLRSLRNKIFLAFRVKNFSNLKRPICSASSKKTQIKGAQAAGLFALLQQAKGSNDEPPIVSDVKRGLLAQSRLEYQKAEQFFHNAIKLYDEQDPKDKNEIHRINIYLYLANLYYEKKEFKKSFRLYQECMRELISNHSFENNDEAIVEISLKMSNVFAVIDDEHDAKIGYEFCVQSIISRIKQYELKLDPTSDNTAINEKLFNAKMLFIVVLQTYGRYLCTLKEFKHAVDLLEQAKILAEQILTDKKNDQVGVLHNDLALAYYGLNDFENAIGLLRTGIEFLNRHYESIRNDQINFPDADSKLEFDKQLNELRAYQFTNLSNLCSSFYAQKKYDYAKENCSKALDIYKQNAKNFDQRMKTEVNQVQKTLKTISEIGKKT
jgi:tetratricopeptide (TPR) repeat protein